MKYSLEMIILCDGCDWILGGGETGTIEVTTKNAPQVFRDTLKLQRWKRIGNENFCEECLKTLDK